MHPGIAESYDIDAGTMYFEIEYNELLRIKNESERRFRPLSRFQTIQRELNFVVDEHTRTGDMAVHLQTTHPWIEHVIVDSIFRDDEKVGPGKKSVNFSFSLENHENTISDNDALQVQNMAIEKMAEYGYLLRS